MVGRKELKTQKTVIGFFTDVLGYRCIGNGNDREGYSNVEEDLLAAGLKRTNIPMLSDEFMADGQL